MRPHRLFPALILAAAVWAQPLPPSQESPDNGPRDGEQGRSQLVLPAGAWIKIRVDEPLSSDRNREGDRFSGTLTQSVVADGIIVAHRGQTVEGRVTEAIKAGKAKGTSRLGLELLEIGLVDGQQMPVRTQLIEYQGGPSTGRDAAAIGATTGVGAAIGAAAAGGFGAGMGAIAGAAASTIGVLVTRGRSTEIRPETVVTFRSLEPITISTARAPHAFQQVTSADYDRQALERRPAPQRQRSPGYLYNPYFYGGPSIWYGRGYPYWGRGGWGPGYFGGPRVIVRGGGGRGYGRRR